MKDFSEPQHGNRHHSKKQQNTHKPARAPPVLTAGPEFRSDSKNEVGREDQCPPRPSWFQQLQVIKANVLLDLPDIVASRHPVQQQQHRDPAKEGGNAAQPISDVAHEASLWPHILYFTSCSACRPPILILRPSGPRCTIC